MQNQSSGSYARQNVANKAPSSQYTESSEVNTTSEAALMEDLQPTDDPSKMYNWDSKPGHGMKRPGGRGAAC